MAEPAHEEPSDRPSLMVILQNVMSVLEKSQQYERQGNTKELVQIRGDRKPTTTQNPGKDHETEREKVQLWASW